MTKVAVMRKNFDGTEWKRVFASALISLRPDMNPDRADELSDSEYLRSRSLEPTIAAQHWVLQAAASEGSDESNPGPTSHVG